MKYCFHVQEHAESVGLKLTLKEVKRLVQGKSADVALARRPINGLCPFMMIASIDGCLDSIMYLLKRLVGTYSLQDIIKKNNGGKKRKRSELHS